MKLLSSRGFFPLLCLAVGVVVFSVSYTMLGEGSKNGDTNAPESPAAANEMMFKAILEDDVERLKLALAGGADPNAFNDEGISALQWAILGSGTAKTVYGQVKALLTAGANPNLVDSHGMTPVHAAAMHGASESVMDALLGAGGDPKITTTLAGTPYEMAVMGGNDGASAAVERKTKLSLEDRAFLEALGAVRQKIKKDFDASATDQKRKNIIRDVTDSLTESGFLSKADAEALYRQLIEEREVHKFPDD